eukprot:COSAG01_NODE_155_length_23814_cov_12.061343_8_plen_74_part_00
MQSLTPRADFGWLSHRFACRATAFSACHRAASLNESSNARPITTMGNPSTKIPQIIIAPHINLPFRVIGYMSP